jgi:hypothetical protein
MKILTTVFLTFLCASSIFAQQATSVANGSWSSPMTWDCLCVPTPGYDITINHEVSMSFSFGYTSGSLVINPSGKLIKDSPDRDLWVNGGVLTNNGTLEIRDLWTQSGDFSNGGNIELRAFLSQVPFTNTGTFNNIDSIYITAKIINEGSFLNVDSITIDNEFVNHGNLECDQITILGTLDNKNHVKINDLTNLGTIQNTGLIEIFNSGWNLGIIENEIAGKIEINNSFTNNAVSTTNAEITNHGFFEVSVDFSNMNKLKGGATGRYIVHQISYNSGIMEGEYDFCDLTPPPSPPFIDFNSGTIDPNITWCEYLSINPLEQVIPKIYPIPANQYVTIESETTMDYVTLMDLQGKTVAVISPNSTMQTMDISSLKAGIYFIKIKMHNTISVQKITIVN